MRGWRGALGAKLPGPVLRGVADRIAALRGQHSDYLPSSTAESVREHHQMALQAALDAAGLVAKKGHLAGEPALLLAREDLPKVADLESIAEHGGLRLLEGGSTQHGFRFRSKTVGGSGRAAVDRALSALLVIDERSAVDILEPDFDVDLVYTWVDADDPAWAARRQAAKPGSEYGSPATSNDIGRFTSHDELRYSLRSVAYFAPWVRRIHLVTAGQVPKWLDTSNDKIRVVDHSEIFRGDGNLPTFNSHAIESQLHRIPGLAEHFIYMNDDVFFGHAVRIEDFFTPAGQTRFFLSENRIREPGPGELPVDIAARNNRRVIEERFGKTTSRKFLHSPHSQLRSRMERIESEHEVEVAATAAATFRSNTDLSIPSSLAHYYGLACGTAVPSQITYSYVDISAPRAQLQLLRLMRRIPSVFCLNEVEALPGGEPEVSDMVRHFLLAAFPLAASFEVEAHTRGPEENY